MVVQEMAGGAVTTYDDAGELETTTDVAGLVFAVTPAAGLAVGSCWRLPNGVLVTVAGATGPGFVVELHAGRWARLGVTDAGELVTVWASGQGRRAAIGTRATGWTVADLAPAE